MIIYTIETSIKDLLIKDSRGQGFQEPSVMLINYKVVL